MNPYQNLPERAFWKPAVAQRSMYEIESFWVPKFNLRSSDKVSTYGSCFAQHIGNSLKAKGFSWYVPETSPFGLSAANARTFNYGVFSARTGNIYTSSLLKQWLEWAFDLATPPEEVWVKNKRYFDPFRPAIEPDGFESEEELFESRTHTINMFKKSIVDCDYFVFTMGLTESWFNQQAGYEYPMCPGVVAGEYNENIHTFKNQQFSFILKNLADSINIIRKYNPKLKLILTVSPVPLTATYSKNHVGVATIESKSILRAIAGQLSTNRSYVDYFPSYEIISSPIFKGSFFEPNLRTVSKFGVNFVMNTFFESLSNKFGKHSSNTKKIQTTDEDDVVCEEQLLEVFGK